MHSGIRKFLRNKRGRKPIEAISIEKMTERNREVFFNSRFFTQRVRQEENREEKRRLQREEREKTAGERRETAQFGKGEEERDEQPKAPNIFYREETVQAREPEQIPRLGEESAFGARTMPNDFTQQENISEQAERISQEVRRASYRYGVGMEDWQFDEFAV